MKLKHTFALSSLVLAMGFQAHAQETQLDQKLEKSEEQIEKITIVGVRQGRVSQGATGLTMEISETPQSISVVSAEQIQNYAASDLNDALRLATGVNVEEFETNRTNYTARGFEIKNTQIDGVGLPNDWGIVTGSMEAYGYENVEVIRGANALLTGVGNASGTINYVRKRPTNENQGEIGVQLGSFNTKRVQADYSVLLTENGSWAARGVVAVEGKESHIDGLENDRTYLYGVVDGQLTDNSTLTAGFSYQDANSDGIMWGGLIYNYTDGTQAEWDTGASTGQEWTKWDTINTTAFIEYAYLFDNDWEVKLSYNHQIFEDEHKGLNAFTATPAAVPGGFIPNTGIDKASGYGLIGISGSYDHEFKADLIDLTAKGEYALFGRDHELMLGASYSKSNNVGYDHASPITYFCGVALAGCAPTPAFPYAFDAIAEPNWEPKRKYSEIDVTLARFFGSTKLNITDRLFVIAGFNAIKYNREGTVNSAARNVNIDNDESEISPYAGVTFAITDDINTYVSYSDIYQPQEQYGINGEFLDPTKGVNYELGVKAQWFEDNLLTTFAVFSAEQKNLAKVGGLYNGEYYYVGTDVKSEGFEMEIVGHVTDNVNVLLGYTLLSVENFAGESTNEWAPQNIINFSVDYTLPQMPAIQFGLGGKWQSKARTEDVGTVEQDAYLLMNAFARWNITDALNVQVNINNLTDEKYITSLYTLGGSLGAYGAPVNGSASITYSF